MTWTSLKLHSSILFHFYTYTLYFELAHTWKQKHKCAPMENYDNRKTANDKNWFGLLNINPRTWLNIVHILSTKIKETNNGSKKSFEYRDITESDFLVPISFLIFISLITNHNQITSNVEGSTKTNIILSVRLRICSWKNINVDLLYTIVFKLVTKYIQ